VKAKKMHFLFPWVCMNTLLQKPLVIVGWLTVKTADDVANSRFSIKPPFQGLCSRPFPWAKRAFIQYNRLGRVFGFLAFGTGEI
jgi:hypothetical protein